MVFLALHDLILLQASQPQPTPSLARGLAGMFPWLVLFFVIMYLFIIRPQRKEEEKKRKLMESLRKNDRVITIGGLHGTIKEVRSDTVLLTVSDGVQLKFNKSAISTVLKRGSERDGDARSSG